MKAMILAAGLGTRLKPFTDNHPKALAVVNGKTLLQRNIEYLVSFGIKNIIINLHHFGDQIKELLAANRNFNTAITFSDESSKLLETGGGLKKAASFFNNNDPFLLMNADILTDLDLRKMIEAHETSNAIATLAITSRATTRYLLFDQQNSLCGWRNTNPAKEIITKNDPPFTQKAFSGIHIISTEIFSYLKANDNADDKEKFSIIDSYLQIIKHQKIVGFDHSGGKLVDVGNPESIKVAEELFI